MKAASLSEIKKELSTLPAGEVLELCIRLAKYKKENKELLNYLIFEAGNEPVYIKNIKAEIDSQFLDINQSNIYYAKKSVRKILRMTNKYIKYSGSAETAATLLIYFCKKLKKSGIPIHKSLAMENLYDRQIQKILKAMKSMHEDLQFDYEEELKMLSLK